MVCFSSSLVLMCLRNQLGAAVFSTRAVEPPVVPKEDSRSGGRLGSECQLRTLTGAVNLQRQQRVDTGVGGIRETLPPIVYIRQNQVGIF